MGRSMSAADLPDQLEKVPAPITIRNEALNRSFQVFLEGRNIHQSEFELGPDGKEVFKSTQKIEYVIGAGANGFAYVARRGSYLVQAPLSYYSSIKAWGLSPGYDAGDYGFSRTIVPSCIVCHSGLPNVAPGRDGLYGDPPFRELAIGCENCHGPGQLHVEERLKGSSLRDGSDKTIVNPRYLPSWLADNICMSCHQGGDVRVVKPGRTYLDYRPGTPVDNTVAIFAIPFSRETPPDSPLLQHFSLMILSRCYQESPKEKKLSCITCHDPHKEPSGAAAVAYFRLKCLGCHTEQSCTVPIKVREEQTPADDCAGCHMPKQSLGGIAHSALTNHRIIASKGEPFPEYAFHQTKPELPGLIHLDAVPGARTALDPVVVLQAYDELKDSRPEYRQWQTKLLDNLAHTEPDNPVVLAALARKRLQRGSPAGVTSSIRDLSRIINHGSVSPQDLELLAELLTKVGRAKDAIAILQKGIALDPYDRRFYSLLLPLYVSTHDYSRALQTMKDELQVFPQDDSMRSLLQQIEALVPGNEP